MPPRTPTNLLLMLLPLLVASVGWRNPIDALLRGKWVRYWDTLIAEETGTVCAPAESWDELPRYVDELPAVVTALREAGVRAVGIHLPTDSLSGHEQALREAAGDMPLLLPSDAHVDMRRAWSPRTGLGAEHVDGSWPMSVAVLAAAHGGEPSWDGDELVVGPHRWVPTHDYLIFMPVLIPFHHWDRREEWSAAEGQVVFIGACRIDRELTRYGRQPSVVAHGEMVETVLEGRYPRQLPAGLDVLLALLTGAAAWVSRGRWALAPIAVGVVAVGGALALSLTGLWPGLTGLALAALTWGVMPRD